MTNDAAASASAAGPSAPGGVGALDALPLSPFHWKVVLLSGVGWMFDAMNTLLPAMVLPVLIGAWSLSPAQAGLVGTVDRLGALCGAALAGLLADRHGRRLLCQATLLVYSLGSGLLALAGSLASFLPIRFVVGLGLGGYLPVASTLTSELVPPGRRGWLVSILTSFWAYGWALAALLGFLVVPVPGFGWQAAFLVGALPALYVFVLRRALPESPRYLLAQGRVGEAERVLQAAGVRGEQGSGSAGLAVPGADPPSLGVRALFGPPYLRRTLLVWTIWFCLNFTFYGIFIWLPSLLVARGLGLVRSLQYTLLIVLAQLPGYFLTGYLADRVGRRWTFVGLLPLAAVCGYLFGGAQDPGTTLLWGALLTFFYVGTWSIAYTYTPEVYPTAIRATGAGWAQAFGRGAATLAPFSVGLLLEQAPGPQGQALVFLVMVGFFLLAAAAMAALAVETKGRPLESLAGAA